MPFSEEELKKILAGCDTYDGDGQRLEALAQLMLWSGLRIGDACTIGREKIIKDAVGCKVELRTSKTGTNVCCPLPDYVAQAVINQPGKYPFWTGESNAEDCAATWRKAFARLFKQVGLPEAHPHRFRHTFAKRLLLSETPIELVSQLLGHRKLQATQQHYSKWVPERQENLDGAVRNSWKRMAAREGQKHQKR